jgi:hypothetical protein
MSARSIIALAMISASQNMKRKQVDDRSRHERQDDDRRLSLFSGRGIACLGLAPMKSSRDELPADADDETY